MNYKNSHFRQDTGKSCRKFAILHTEASPGWGGQELRILREAEGMRKRGHCLFFAVQRGGGLVNPAREAGFTVYELSFKKISFFLTFIRLIKIVLKHRIQIINTHSSLDAWIAGFVGKLFRRSIIRTRHLSTRIKGGLNSKILYKWLAGRVVTTCQTVAESICKQANLTSELCRSIPTGVNPNDVIISPNEVNDFRKQLGVTDTDCLIGTVCVLRGWKGISDFLQAAKYLENQQHLKWVIVGGGVSEVYFRKLWNEMGLEKKVFFTGHLSPPYTAIAAMDIFLLLSWDHEGVSQSSLQAAWLEKPLITTNIGGLPEVCLDGKTGLIVPPHDPQTVAKAVMQLSLSPQLRKEMGKKAKEVVVSSFTFDCMLNEMEKIYQSF